MAMRRGHYRSEVTARSEMELVMVTSPNSGPCSHGPGGEKAAAPEIEQSRDRVLLILVRQSRHVSDV